MATPLYMKLFQTVQDLEASGKTKLSADERAIIERETADLLSKSKLKGYRFASSVPKGFEKLLEELKSADAEEAYKLVKDFMDDEGDEDEEHEEHEEKEEKSIKQIDEGVEDLKDVEEEEEMEEIKKEVKKEEKDSEKGDKPDFGKDKEKDKDMPDFGKEDKKDKKDIMARIKERRAQMKDLEDMPGKGLDRGDGFGKGEGPGKGPMDKDGPKGKPEFGKDKDKIKLKDLQKKTDDKDKKPSMDEMGILDVDADPMMSSRANKIRVKVTAERNIIAYHEDFGPVFVITPSAKVKQNKTALVRLANRAYGLAVYRGFKVASRSLGGRMLRNAGVDDDVEVVTEETPETPAKAPVTKGVDDVIDGEDYDEQEDKVTNEDDTVIREAKKLSKKRIARPRRAQHNLGQELDKWLGSSSLSDFTSEDEVREYFTQENAENMWGPGDYSDAADVCEYAVEKWNAGKTARKHPPRRAWTKVVGWNVDDGSSYEEVEDWDSLLDKVSDWYWFITEQRDDLPEDWTLPSIDLKGLRAGDVEGLNARISDWENNIAESLDYSAFHGHGNYSVSPASAMGLNLRVEAKKRPRMAAEGDVTDGGCVVTEEKPNKVPNDVTAQDDDEIEEPRRTPNDSVLDGDAVDFKTARKLEANYRKLYAARLKKAQENFVRKFARCMRITSQRMLLNYEKNPMKLALTDVLTSDNIEFENGELFRPMDTHIAVQLTELASSEGHTDFVNHLMDRTADLMEKADEYLKDAEADLEKLAPVAVEVKTPTQASTRPARSAQKRRAASRGNFGLEGHPTTPRTETPSLRDAVAGGDFAVSRALSKFRG